MRKERENFYLETALPPSQFWKSLAQIIPSQEPNQIPNKNLYIWKSFFRGKTQQARQSKEPWGGIQSNAIDELEILIGVQESRLPGCPLKKERNGERENGALLERETQGESREREIPGKSDLHTTQTNDLLRKWREICQHRVCFYSLPFPRCYPHRHASSPANVSIPAKQFCGVWGKGIIIF